MEKQKVGRPPKLESRNCKSNTRFTALEYETVKSKAEDLDMSISEFMRESALKPNVTDHLSSMEALELSYEVSALKGILSDISDRLEKNPTDISHDLQERIFDVTDVLLRIQAKI